MSDTSPPQDPHLTTGPTPPELEAPAGAESPHPPGDLLPAVSVIVPTHKRPDLLRRTIASIVSQTTDQVVETIVVFDQDEPDPTLTSHDPHRPVRVIVNDSRTPGLAGARNAGVIASSAPLIAFCDDDDYWLPTKLERQLPVLEQRPDIDIVAAGCIISINDRHVGRELDGADITLDDLLGSRVMAANPCTILVRREAFLERIGFVDETLPGSYAEDYEWLLRAARVAPIAVVPSNLTVVHWHGKSFFSSRWRMIDEALAKVMADYPEFERHPAGLSRITGQRAFALASAGDRRAAVAMVGRTLRLNWRQPRAYLALLVACRLVSSDRIVRDLNARGRGI